MKNVLVLIHDDRGQEARFQAARDIARALRGHLKCLDVTAMFAAAVDPVAIDGGVLLMAQERERESANKARLQQRLATEDVSWDWADVTAYLPDAVYDNTLLADLIVLNRALDDEPFPDMLHMTSKVVLKSGKPVVAVPGDCRRFDVAGAALVAWDGSDEAAAALAAAVPLLALAASVTIAQVEDGSIRAPAEEAAAYLSRHGIASIVLHCPPAADPASAVLIAMAGSGRYDWLAMGGFGHARLVEAIFGGVTRRMLKASPIPLFLAR